jgi:hypothetical protein
VCGGPLPPTRRQNAGVSALKPQYGPSLVQILAGRSLALRVAAGAAAAALLVAVVMVALSTRPDETAVLVREPVTFNLVYGPKLERVSEPGAILALRSERDGVLLDSYVIRDLRLPAYRGAVGGMLPTYAFGYERSLRRRYPGYEFVGEGRTRVNNGIGYQLNFRAKLGARALYVRHLLLVEELPEGRRRGVVIELESTYAAGTLNVASVGDGGALKAPLRSFRFGEDREGGTA